MSRKSTGKKLRFEILKRDKFTCCYCGRKAPDVVLHVDHLVPVSKGGTNDPLNLITACADCNGGKSDRELSNADLIEKRRLQAESLQDRINAAHDLAEWQINMVSMKPEIDAINKVMCELGNCQLSGHGESLVRRLLKKYTLNDVICCVPIAVEKNKSGVKEFGKSLEFECKKLVDERERPGICAIWSDVWKASKSYGGRDHYGKQGVVDSLWILKKHGYDPHEVSIECFNTADTWDDYVALVMAQVRESGVEIA